MATPREDKVARKNGCRSAPEGRLHQGAGGTLGCVMREPEKGIITLADGTVVPFRPIKLEDAPALKRFHRRLSSHSVHLRFFGSKPELSDKKARYFACVDGIDRFALVALDPELPEEIIATTGFYRLGNTDRAEYAVAVEDRWQGRGLGLALTRQLIRAAVGSNVRVFTCVVLAENARVLDLPRDLCLPERLRYEKGTEYVEIET
jgi:RimJ/RimL family protein N-acetyltransferase